LVPSSGSEALAVVGHKGLEFDRALYEIGWSPDSITLDLATLLDTTDELMQLKKSSALITPVLPPCC